MPTYMFEKISPPVRRTAQAVTLSEPRGVIVQMLDKLADSRLQREARAVRRAQNRISFTEADITPTRTRGG